MTHSRPHDVSKVVIVALLRFLWSEEFLTAGVLCCFVFRTFFVEEEIAK